ncbi:hypothetical protein CASFOL_017443 [Castilleja foliolosa]|uniref:Pectinesterase inhibitor domain-containing protein n=1 Tax=Castilleja foliolosa TaxID=1961234 RepID=A0ABD3DF34_9LAMI
MATSSLLYATLLLVLISLIATSGAPVDDVCSQTKDPALCLRDFSMSEPGIRTQTIEDLSGTVVRKAKLEASQMGHYFHDSTSKPGDLDNQCENLYNDAVAALYAADEAVKGRRYEEVKTRAGYVRSNVDRCEALFGGKSPVHPWSPDIVVYTEALIVIVNMLDK